MSRLVLLLEERSMKVFLDGFLPRYLPGLEFLCVAHEGKQDLEKSIPRKLRAWAVPGDRFVVIRDNDRGDCLALKAALRKLCADAGRPDSLIRIACQELEAWYLGDPAALAEAYKEPSLAGLGDRARYRDPDAIPHPSRALEKEVPAFQKVMGARLMAKHIDASRNRSRSFLATIEGLARYREQMPEED